MIDKVDNMSAGGNTPQKRLKNFLSGKDDAYAIMQLKPARTDELFMSYKHLKKQNKEPEFEHYNTVYVGDLTHVANISLTQTLEGLFTKFNIYQPPGFKGHSLSTSDIIGINCGGLVSFYFVDSIGFKKLDDFLPESYKKTYGLTDAADGAVGHSIKIAGAYDCYITPLYPDNTQKCTGWLVKNYRDEHCQLRGTSFEFLINRAKDITVLSETTWDQGEVCACSFVAVIDRAISPLEAGAVLKEYGLITPEAETTRTIRR